MERSLLISIVVLVLINVTDSITNSVVGPSLIFYVTDMGGTKEQYGLIMSASFFSGILMMSFFGTWVDGNGNKYTAPYSAAFALGIVGSLIYFLGAIFPKGHWAIGAILVGRLITGLGASGRTLAYSWVATAIPRDEQRTVLTILSMTRTVGMMLGPLLNLLVAKVDTQFLGIIPINPNNAPGLVVALGEGMLFVATVFLLVDPPTKEESVTKNETKPKPGLRDIWDAITHFDLFFCILNFFVVVFNFTFYSVAIPPVALHAFDWTPVEISNVLAAQAVVLFLGMVAAMALSMTKVPDVLMIGFGQACFVVGGVMTYFCWKTDGSPMQFVLPIIIVSLAYPFIGPANRSKFTKGVHSRPELENSHGIMSSIFNQSIMIGGLVAPNFVTALILRGPGEAPDSKYELSPWAWVIPISSTLMIIGLLYEEVILGKNELGLYAEEEEEEDLVGELEEAPVTEKTRLMVAGKRASRGRRRSSVAEINQCLSNSYERDRRHSCEANGIINPFETRDEIAMRQQLLADKEAWEEIAKIGAAMGDVHSRE